MEDYASLSKEEILSILYRRGKTSISPSTDRAELIRLAEETDRIDFDQEAVKLFRKVNLSPSRPEVYANLNAIWRHVDGGRTSGIESIGTIGSGGGVVYVGNLQAAGVISNLRANDITAVVNCQGLEAQNFFEWDTSITYHRFPIAQLYPQHRSKIVSNVGAALQYFQPTFDFIDSMIASGRSVLIHCFAGAHRAGTLGTAYLMYKTRMSAEDSIRAAKRLRPIIDPFGILLELLSYLDRDIVKRDADRFRFLKPKVQEKNSEKIGKESSHVNGTDVSDMA